MEGRSLGEYLVKERLGGGGGGDVYRAEQVMLGREAVIKVVRQNLESGSSASATERFLREARLASQLDHPFAAHVYGFGAESDGTLWIAMEFVRGVSLETFLEQTGPLPLPRFVPFFERLCEVVQAAHDQGIVHRDIKPANIMAINRAGRLLPKLLDLGIAKRWSEQSQRDDTQHEPDDLSPQAVEFLGVDTIVDRLSGAETARITLVGSLIGTPRYMAPEQWADASSADLRSDLYSLGLVAFQMLTGKPAFTATSLKQLAKAHFSAPLPALPAELPAELYAVLAKAAAKSPDDRYQTAIEFGAALRQAAGLTKEPFVLPQLDDRVRETVLAEAPQPIAEAIALLEAARTPRQQLEVALGAVKVTRHLTGLLAIAARARVGSGRAADDEGVVALLRKLAAGRLEGDEWSLLAAGLCKPFARKQQAHPLPELVAFFYENIEAMPGKGARALSAIEVIEQPAKEAPDEAVHSVLLKLVPALGELLRSMSPLFDYALVVQQDENERWMGTRRAKRLVQTIESKAPADRGTVRVIDSSGVPVLDLNPLVQVFSPGGDMLDEMFLLDGSGRHGARFCAPPTPFERYQDGVWSWLSTHVTDIAAEQTNAARTERAPYKGLSTFTANDADNYFGREREAEAFANRLRLTSLLAVIGPSGSGKSSFVLAGVLPLLPKGWRALVARPGAAPFEAFATSLRQSGFLPAGLEADSVVAALGDDTSLLVVIDQFEELVTLCADPKRREEFASFLVELAQHKSGRVKVVMTLRDDFLIKVQQLTAFRQRLSQSLQLLGTPAKEDLMRVVTMPAARVGYTFDDPSLPARMVDEVGDYAGALALLSFTASQLWELRDRHQKEMRLKTYEALGGVGGALANHAETTLAMMTTAEAKLVRESFRHLVTGMGTRAVLSRSEMLDVLGNSTDAQSVLEKLIHARLLVASDKGQGHDDERIEIIHEALIVSWPRLVDWLKEDAETARFRDSLRASAKQWGDRGRPSGLLWRKETLAEYKVWRRRFAGRLTQLEDSFSRASLREEAVSRRIRLALATTAFVALVIGLLVVLRAYGKADASAEEAKRRVQALWQEQGRLAMVDERPMEAFVYSVAAKEAGAAGPELDHVLGASVEDLKGGLAASQALKGQVVAMQVDVVGKRLFAATPSEIAQFALPTLQLQRSWPGACPLIALTPNGLHLVAVCADREVKIINLLTDQIKTLTLNTRGLDVHVSPDSTRVIVGQIGNTLTVRSLDGAGLFDIVADPPARLLHGEFAPTGEIIVYAGPYDPNPDSYRSLTAYRDGKRVWSVARAMPIRFVKLMSKKPQVFWASWDGSFGVVDLSSGQVIWEAKPSRGGISTAAMNDAETEVATTDATGVVRTWSLENGALHHEIRVSSRPVRCFAWADARTLMTAGTDAIVRRVDVEAEQVVYKHHGHLNFVAECLVAGDQFVTGDSFGSIWGWDIARQYGHAVTTSGAAELFGQNDSPVYAMITSEGATVTWLDGGTARVNLPLKDHASESVVVDSEASWGVAVKKDSLNVIVRDGGVFDVGATYPSSLSISKGVASRDGASVAVPLRDGKIAVVSRGGPPAFVEQPDDIAVSVLFDESTLFTGSALGNLYAWDRRTLKLTNKQQLHTGAFLMAPCREVDCLITFGRDRRMLKVRPSTLETVLVIENLAGTPQTVVESPDGAFLFMVFSDGLGTTYSAKTGQRLSSLKHPLRIDTVTARKEVAESATSVLLSFEVGQGVWEWPLFPVLRTDLDVIERCRLPLAIRGEKITTRHPTCASRSQ